MRSSWRWRRAAWSVMLAGCPGPTEATTEVDLTMPGATTIGTTTGTSEGTSEAPTTGAEFFGVRLATLGTYLPRAGEPVAASVDPQAGGVTLTVEVDGKSFPGVYDGGQWVEFADVPEVMYRLKRVGLPNPDLPGTAGVVTYTETSERMLGVGQVFSGRPDVALGSGDATALTLAVGDMRALVEGDEFELYSYDADALVFAAPSLVTDDGTASPLPGDTALDGWIVPWAPQTSRPGTPLVDPSVGDVLWLTHLVRAPLIAAPTEEELQDAWGYASVVSAREMAELSLAPMVDGQTAAASGGFVTVGGASTTVKLPLSQYATVLAAEFAPTSALNCTATLFVEPGVDLPVYGMTPTLARVEVATLELPVDPLCPPDACDPQTCPDGCETTLAIPGDREVEFTYVNPYALGTEALMVYCSDAIGAVHPTAGTPEALFADVSAGRPLAELASKPANPTLGLVGNIRVNDAPLPPTEVATGVGATPTISFSPPSGTTPDYYAVQVRTLEDVVDEADNIVSRRRLIASVLTTSTSVTLPAGLLEAGSYYHVLVAAQFGQELGAGRPHSHTSGYSRAPSGMFTP